MLGSPVDAPENAASDAASITPWQAFSVCIQRRIHLSDTSHIRTPSLSGGLMAMSSIFVATNSLLLPLHKSDSKRDEWPVCSNSVKFCISVRASDTKIEINVLYIASS
ncbi:hypothetical protein MLD38_005895 [Melastoma candidum]|uniref:Uncharacterized protein n=1 Tax=Melastoma candidum TaxID=119954 RepID=A0ACB9RL53_9MYRT|nr:hypothetical protein MLD38_005895 [Melastoma candidum]